MRFRILGPLEVDGVADDAVLRRSKPRALLALLLLSANRPVATETLVAGLWGDEEPPTALGALQNYVSQLRKALGRDVIRTRAPGYMLVVAESELDLQVFERLVAEAKAADVATRAELLREALALWRGPPLADLAYEPFAAAEIARLENARLAATEQRIEAELALGRHAELVGELDHLVNEHPLRERLRAHLILALYRSARQADALDAYHAARAALDEIGLEPNAELQRLERMILQQDPELDAPTPAAPPRAAPAPVLRAGRRTATVLFADVSGSTALGETLDPETLRGVMSGFFDEMRATIERHGGMVEKFAGDDVMAVFGVPATHEDDALRAVRAAVEMRTAVEALDLVLASEHGVNFQLRIGVNTGEVVTGDATTGGPFVTGPPVNLGKRLQELAEPGDIVLGGDTVRLVRDAVDVEPLGPRTVRGKAEPVEAFRVVQIDPAAAGVARAFHTPFVGREQELGGLRRALESARAERRCRVVAMLGNAGIGKTRLARALAEPLGDEALLLVGRCVAYGDGATYLPLVDAFRDVRDELAAATADVDDGELILREIDGLSGSGDATPRAETAWAVRRALELLARDRPVVVVFDDVHWGQPTFLDLVEYVGAWVDDAPVLVLALARPELLELRPTWADPESGVENVRLGPLSADEIRALVDNLASASVGDEQRARVAELAEGFPLFAEQLVAWLEETGGLEAVPSTIEALLASRVDLLDADERAVLERAAVVGRDFWRGAIVALSPEPELAAVNRHLMSLLRRGLVRPARSDLPREDALRFHHVLLRDVTYAGIPKAVRAELHERCADWLERRAAEPDEIVGYHLEQAHRYRIELGPGDRAVRRLGAEAGERLGRAGVRALARGDSPAAVTLLSRAAPLLPSADALGLELLAELGVSHRMAGDLERAEAVLGDAVREATAARDRRLELRARLELAAVRLIADPEGASTELLRVAEAGIPVFEALGDDRSLGRAWFATGYVRGAFHCQNAAWEDAAERALVHYRRAGWPTSTCVQELASSLFYGPHPVEDAIRRCDELLADEVTDHAGTANVTVWRGALDALRGHLDDARAAVAHARSTFNELGQQTSAAITCDFVGGMIEMLADDPEAAQAILRPSAEFLASRGERAHLANRAAELADALHAVDRVREALEWSAVARTNSASDDLSAQFTWRAVRAKAIADDGSVDAAEALAREALELVDRTDALNQRANVRLDLAYVLGRANRSDAIASIAHEAAALYEQKGNVVGSRRARRPPPA